MRRRPTKAENRLWQALRREALAGVKFRRQHAIGPFIVDFYCVQARLVVEVDGPVHRDRVEADDGRTAYLEGWGLIVLRFSNDDVLSDTPRVISQIARQVVERSSPLSSQGERVGGEVTPTL
jgi:very-short-patch-repair endonuclease